MDNPNKKPPLGIMPRWLWDEDRLKEIRGAMESYYRDNRPLRIDWIEEYNELIEKIHG